MLKFFRKIRQNLLTDNKYSKYLLYAIGEIILVVIGILIALQVSNLNSERINDREEVKALNSLNAEFRINRDIMNAAIESNESSINTGKYIMSLINTDLNELKTHNTDSLLFEIFEYDSFNITENSILELMQSSKLQNLKNDSLRTRILEWSQKKSALINTGESLKTKSEYLVNYLMTRYPLKNIDAYGVLNWDKPSSIKNDKYAIFYDLQFENIIDDYLYNLVNYNTRFKELQVTIDNIIDKSTL